MASPFFYERLAEQVGAELRLSVHLREASVFVLQLLQPTHQRHVHATELRAPLIKGRGADAMRAAQVGDFHPCLGVLRDRHNLAIGKPGCLHGNLLQVMVRKFHVSCHLIQRGITRAPRIVAFMPVSLEMFKVDEREGSAAYGDDEPLHTHRSLAPHLC